MCFIMIKKAKSPNSLSNFAKRYFTLKTTFNEVDNCETYEKYGGSYAQDVMGYSDDDIDTIFDGDPDAYWNID